MRRRTAVNLNAGGCGDDLLDLLDPVFQVEDFISHRLHEEWQAFPIFLQGMKAVLL
jgi:hypothetical protein